MAMALNQTCCQVGGLWATQPDTGIGSNSLLRMAPGWAPVHCHYSSILSKAHFCASLSQRDLWLKFLETELKHSLKTQRAHVIIHSRFALCVLLQAIWWQIFIRQGSYLQESDGWALGRPPKSSSLLQFIGGKTKGFGCVGGRWKWVCMLLLNRAKTC